MWLKPSINSSVTKSWSVFKESQVIIKNNFPYGENKWDFNFRNLTVALYRLQACIQACLFSVLISLINNFR